jgi:anti-anti-sigma regulatory factor
MMRERAVIVRHLSETFDGSRKSLFFSEIKACLDVDRPCLVIDCSQLTQFNKQTLLLLLECLEQAMKRNGDVRLAGVSSQAREALQAAGADALFSIFETKGDAIASFQRRSIAHSLRRAGSYCTDDVGARCR